MTKSNPPGSLTVPRAAFEAREKAEAARVWIADGTLQVTLNPMLFEDPAIWGIALVDIANHVANALEEATGVDSQEVLARIREGVDAEWSHPTDERTGEFVEES